jgi:hypothetical protein
VRRCSGRDGGGPRAVCVDVGCSAATAPCAGAAPLRLVAGSDDGVLGFVAPRLETPCGDLSSGGMVLRLGREYNHGEELLGCLVRRGADVTPWYVVSGRAYGDRRARLRRLRDEWCYDKGVSRLGRSQWLCRPTALNACEGVRSSRSKPSPNSLWRNGGGAFGCRSPC